MTRLFTITLIAFSVIMALGLNSCKSKKKLISGSSVNRVRGKVLNQVLKSELEYHSIEIKGSVRTDALGKKQSFNITYRNVKDSLIWISARAMLGIEVGRVICTRDSVWVFSRIARVKEKGDWKTMSNMIGYPIDFYSMQGLMTRKLFVPGRSDTDIINSYLSRRNENGKLLIPDYSDPDQKIILKNYGFLPQFLINTKKKLLYRTRISNEDSSWILDVIYGEGSNKNLRGLPPKVRIEGTDMEEKMFANLRIVLVKIDQELKFPFAWF